MKKTITPIFFIIILCGDAISQNGWIWVNPYPTAEELTTVQFVSKNIGYAAGHFGTFLRTIDGGINWEVSRIDSFYCDYTILVFLNENTGFVYGCGIY